MVDVRIERLLELPPAHLAPLIAESEQAGLRFVSRLAEEWASGRNRFDRPGEALFGALTDGCLVGVCGLNVVRTPARRASGACGTCTC